MGLSSKIRRQFQRLAIRFTCLPVARAYRTAKHCWRKQVLVNVFRPSTLPIIKAKIDTRAPKNQRSVCEELTPHLYILGVPAGMRGAAAISQRTAKVE